MGYDVNDALELTISKPLGLFAGFFKAIYNGLPDTHKSPVIRDSVEEAPKNKRVKQFRQAAVVEDVPEPVQAKSQIERDRDFFLEQPWSELLHTKSGHKVYVLYPYAKKANNNGRIVDVLNTALEYDGSLIDPEGIHHGKIALRETKRFDGLKVIAVPYDSPFGREIFANRKHKDDLRVHLDKTLG